MSLQFWLCTQWFVDRFFFLCSRGLFLKREFYLLGDPLAIYSALTGNQQCMIYDQCAAAGIICGIGSCINPISSDQEPICQCPRPLVQIAVSTLSYDCLCPNASDFYDGYICRPRPTTNPSKIQNSIVMFKDEEIISISMDRFDWKYTIYYHCGL